MQLTTCSRPVGGLVLMRFDPQMWSGAGISPPLGPLVVSPAGLSLWPRPRGSKSWFPRGGGPGRAQKQPGPRGGVGGRCLSESSPQSQDGEARPGKITLPTQLLRAPPWSWKAEMCAAAGGQVRQGGRYCDFRGPLGPAELRTRWRHLSTWS